MVHPLVFILISVMSFRSKYQVWREIWVPEQRADARNYISEVQLAYLFTDQDLLSLEGWSTREASINQLIEFSGVFE